MRYDKAFISSGVGSELRIIATTRMIVQHLDAISYTHDDFAEYENLSPQPSYILTELSEK